jgi:chemotaxis response regulator CheB
LQEWKSKNINEQRGLAAGASCSSQAENALIDDPDRHYGGRTVDLLFKSVAAWAGTRIIGVVLSGSLDDGSRGLAAIHDAGGMTMVLTPARPPQQGMPENAISYDGPIDLIGDLRYCTGYLRRLQVSEILISAAATWPWK